jgi:amino acid transporter
MLQNKNGSGDAIVQREAKKLKRELTLLPLVGLIYFTVSGGSFGIEPLIGYSGPGLAILLIALTPIIFSLPNLLIVQELQTMMPAQGGYYHWVKRAFGPFAGFLAGWNNWVVSWLDVSIYPVFAAMYLSAFIPALDEGATLFGVELSAGFLQWLVAVVMIWFVAWLQIRGSRVTGLFTNTLGVIMIIPLIILSVLGFYVWFKSGVPLASLPFLPGGEGVNVDSLTAAFSTGLFVVMWNFMGWELPSAAGDEVVNPRKTYPRAMAIVLVLAIMTYMIPVVGSLFGGAGEDGRYTMWGIEASDEEVGIITDVEGYGVTAEQVDGWGVSSASDATGWEFPQIAQVVAGKLTGDVNSPFAIFMMLILTISAVLSMTGLFIGNSLAEDGMFPRWMIKVHPRHGSPYVSILVASVIYTLFATNAFEFLVVADVFLQLLVVLAEIAALWVLRRTEPDRPRTRVPGGMPGLVLASVSLAGIILIAFYSQIAEAGWGSVGVSLTLMAVGAVLYFPIRKIYKPGIHDVDPFEESLEEG